MQDNTNYTPYPDDNLLGLVDKNIINEYEAKGLTRAELFTFQLDSEISISTTLILTIHKIAFEQLYDWAGKWRTIQVMVGNIIPAPPNQILQLMYQFIEHVNFKISKASNTAQHLECLVYTHYEFIKIHPFNNGNGRTGRILMNVVALKLGYQPLELYYREGDARKTYINAMKSADSGDFNPLKTLIQKELTSF